jgi:arylsulfatase A-like enzyme
MRGGSWPRLVVVLAGAILAASLLTGAVEARSEFPSVPGDPPPPPGADPRSPRPDIVIFVLDDIPPLDGRVLWERLPNIYRTFIEQGVEFTDFHGETPTCCPGRAGFLTGLHTYHHGAYKTDGSLFQPGMTIATQLRKSGYHTIQVGKYMNLFERVYPKLPPGWSDFHGFGGDYYDYTMWSNGQPVFYGHGRRDFSTDVIRRLTLGALKRAPRDRPIFAWITPYSVHKPWLAAPRHRTSKRCSAIAPWSPPGYMEKDVQDKPAYVQGFRIKSPKGFPLGRVCRGLLSTDQLVGEVTRRLERAGRLDNTLLILTSDNGMTFGAHRILLDKKSPYATQLPFLVRWPRVLGVEPRQVDERVQNIDLAPTLCDIAGCDLGPYPTGQRHPDGTSFLPLLAGEAEALPREAVLTSYLEPDARVPIWSAATSTSQSPLARKVCAARGDAGCRWQYVEYETGERELYDISNGPCWAWKRRLKGDPCMLQNLSGRKRYASIERAMARQLDLLR